MSKKMFLGVLIVFLFSDILIAVINFNVTNAMDSGNTGTIVSGLISENTTWTINESPYIVVGDIFIEENVFLTIDPGVVVKFNGTYSLIVRGALVAKGNYTNRITFTSNQAMPKPWDWGQIYFTKYSIEYANTLDWVIVEYGGGYEYGSAIMLEERSLNVTNSILRFNGIGVRSGGRDSQLTIRNCIITNNTFGIDVSCTYVEVYESTICNNELGINVFAGDPGPTPAPYVKIYRSTLNNNGVAILQYKYSLYIIESNISYNIDGIYIPLWSNPYYLDVHGSIISFNTGTGIKATPLSVHRPTIRITNSTITANKNSGIEFRADTDTYMVHFNKIFNNVPYNIINNSPYGYNVNATYNWWGTANETVIMESIYDYYDDYNLGKVLYKPYLVPPTAIFTFSPEVPYAYGTVTFDASTSFNPYGSIINYTWDFGDGNITTTTSHIITHTYTSPGDYIITLDVIDEFGLTNSTTTILTVSEDNIPPITAVDYDGLWRNTDFTITLTATDHESGVAETYYRINYGPVKSVSVDGQPYITVEGANNTLEYWSVDYAGNEEFPHKILTGIKLDKTSPIIDVPSRIPESDVEPNQEVRVLVNVTDLISGVKNVTLYYTNDTMWHSVPMVFNDTSALWEATIPGHVEGAQVKYKIEAYDYAGKVAVEDDAGQYYTYTVIPEFPSAIILLLFMIISIIFTRKNKPCKNL